MSHSALRTTLILISLLGALLLPTPATAQEANVTPAVTFPAKGRITLRTQYHYMRFNGNGQDLAQHQIWNRFSYGLDRDTTLTMDLPIIARDDLKEGSSRNDEQGLGDARLSIKRRLWQQDSGAYGSSRLGLIGGLELPTGTDDLSSHSIDPFLGLAFMTIKGRHGFNASAIYTLSTSEDDAAVMAGQSEHDLLRLETAYLYRLAPQTYSADTHGAWYLTAETDLLYETNGDTEFYITPGLLYEAKRWAFEFSIHTPIAERVNNRPELDYGFVLGFRYLF